MAIREVEFKRPVYVGDIVSCYATVVRIGTTSITVRVRVVAHNPRQVEKWREVTVAELVYVHVT